MRSQRFDILINAVSNGITAFVGLEAATTFEDRNRLSSNRACSVKCMKWYVADNQRIKINGSWMSCKTRNFVRSTKKVIKIKNVGISNLKAQ